MKKANKRLFWQRVIALIVVLAIVCGIVSFCSINADISGNGNSEETIVVNVQENASAHTIAEKLKDMGVIDHPFLFRLFLKLDGNDSKIQAGVHRINGAMSYSEIGHKLASAPEEKSVSVTIPEGYEFKMIARKLADEGFVDYDKFCDLAENYDFTYEFVNMIPERETRLEGYLFPDTYFISENDDELVILNMMLQQFEANFGDEYKARAAELGMTIDQVVNLASIIQREAGNVSEMPDVSSVFHNRIKSDEYPYLQSCATVQYILEDRKPVLTNEDTKIDSPYNTYINKGLPLGPISSPGADAIHAALYPSDTNYYFFVANGDGTSTFSESFDDHMSAASQGVYQ